MFFFSTELTSRSSSIADTWKIDAEINSSRAELTMPVKNKRSLRALLHEFAEETSAHGIGKIASSESIFWRLFWVLGTMACAGMVIYQGILLFNAYLSKPIKSNIDVSYIRVSSNEIVSKTRHSFYSCHRYHIVFCVLSDANSGKIVFLSSRFSFTFLYRPSNFPQ